MSLGVEFISQVLCAVFIPIIQKGRVTNMKLAKEPASLFKSHLKGK